MNAKSFFLGLLVASSVAVATAQNASQVPLATAKGIFHNLHQIAASAERLYLEQNRTATSIEELVGPTKFINRLVVVANEDHSTLVLKQGTPVVITMPTGETIAVDPLRSEGCTYSFQKVRAGNTADSIAKAAKISIERLRELNPDVDLSQLRASDAVRVR